MTHEQWRGDALERPQLPDPQLIHIGLPTGPLCSCNQLLFNERPRLVLQYAPSILYLLMAAGLWMVFQKAGVEGWKSLIPFYNMWELTKVAHKPRVWFILGFLPIINIILFVPVAKNFGKSGGYAVGLGLLPVIFWPMLGFGSDQYQGPPVED